MRQFLKDKYKQSRIKGVKKSRKGGSVFSPHQCFYGLLAQQSNSWRWINVPLDIEGGVELLL